jgi:hypothetical protein
VISDLTPSAVFKTAAFNHSATLPDLLHFAEIRPTPNSTAMPRIVTGFFCVLWVPAFAGMTNFSVAVKIDEG